MERPEGLSGGGEGKLWRWRVFLNPFEKSIALRDSYGFHEIKSLCMVFIIRKYCQ